MGALPWEIEVKMSSWTYAHEDGQKAGCADPAGVELSIGACENSVDITVRYPEGIEIRYPSGYVLAEDMIASIHLPRHQVFEAVEALLTYGGVDFEEMITRLRRRQGLPGFVGSIESGRTHPPGLMDRFGRPVYVTNKSIDFTSDFKLAAEVRKAARLAGVGWLPEPIIVWLTEVLRAEREVVETTVNGLETHSARLAADLDTARAERDRARAERDQAGHRADQLDGHRQHDELVELAGRLAEVVRRLNAATAIGDHGGCMAAGVNTNGLLADARRAGLLTTGVDTDD